MMLKKAVEQTPGCDGIVLGGHGLFTWGETQRECYLNTITAIDHLGQFVLAHAESGAKPIFGGEQHTARGDRESLPAQIMPFLRGRVSAQQRLLGTFSDLPEVLRFVNSADADRLAFLEQAARTTSSAPRSGPCMFPGIPKARWMI